MSAFPTRNNFPALPLEQYFMPDAVLTEPVGPIFLLIVKGLVYDCAVLRSDDNMTSSAS